VVFERFNGDARFSRLRCMSWYSNTTPNIRSKASQIVDEDDGEEEDEETLQLQLAGS
jgi:hypothetical protein